MGRQMRGALGALLAVGAAFAFAAPATAQTTGNETFSGTIVTSGSSGERVVESSVVVATGVFSGVGRVVEIPNLPTDPDNVSRDELVFADGSIHIVSTIVDFSVSQNGRNCHFRGTIQQTIEVVGGTGRFAAASGSFTGTVTGPALLAHNPDGSCSFPALHEVDRFGMSGTLSF
jgi:hypothetical protein